MNLPFKEEFNNRPTFFIQKIWNSLIVNGICMFDEYIQYKEAYEKKFGRPLLSSLDINITKNCTIRESKRWKVGDKIHLCINNRTKDHFRFAPILEVKHMYNIQIKGEHIYISNPDYSNIKLLDPSSRNQLILNDGFVSIEDFFSWFGYDFEGVIISWLDNFRIFY